MIPGKALERTNDGMFDRKRQDKRNTVDEMRETEYEKFIKGHPGFGLSPGSPPLQPSLFLLGMTLSSVPSLHQGEQDKRS